MTLKEHDLCTVSAAPLPVLPSVLWCSDPGLQVTAGFSFVLGYSSECWSPNVCMKPLGFCFTSQALDVARIPAWIWICVPGTEEEEEIQEAVTLTPARSFCDYFKAGIVGSGKQPWSTSQPADHNRCQAAAPPAVRAAPLGVGKPLVHSEWDLELLW